MTAPAHADFHSIGARRVPAKTIGRASTVSALTPPPNLAASSSPAAAGLRRNIRAAAFAP
jgi:hypothetical protein